MRHIKEFFEIGKWYRVINGIGFQLENFHSKKTLNLSSGSKFLFLKLTKEEELFRKHNTLSMNILHENKVVHSILFGEKSYFADNLKLYLEKIS